MNSGAFEHSRSGGVPRGQPANECSHNEGAETCGCGLRQLDNMPQHVPGEASASHPLRGEGEARRARKFGGFGTRYESYVAFHQLS